MSSQFNTNEGAQTKSALTLLDVPTEETRNSLEKNTFFAPLATPRFRLWLQRRGRSFVSLRRLSKEGS